MEETVGIFAGNFTTNTGPGKVVNNLLLGLKKNGVEYEINSVCELNGCLQPTNFNLLPPSTVIGPNIMVLPKDMPYVWEMFKYHVSPSIYVKNIYSTFEEVKNCVIDVWPVGIDTDKFSDRNKNIKYDFLIYYKNRKDEELSEVIRFLNKNNFTFNVLKYGTYNEHEFLKLLSESRSCILLTNTESQGIAYMEILSTNTPCIVYSIESKYNMPHSSAPYFDSRCGIKVDTINEDVLYTFLQNHSTYCPRQYIIENHTLQKSATNYINLLKKAKEEK